ncbi:bifunctional hydroxymethylpyrimidine kinase/phosphomethylpyrimidine kinase [Shigella flexneri]
MESEKNVVLDTFAQKAATRCFHLRRLLRCASIIATGFINNAKLAEAAALLDAPHARTEQEMLEQGRSLLAMGCGAVLMKGGHLDDDESPDWLFTREVNNGLPHRAL